MFYSREEIIEYRNNPDVIEGLTWTADDEANEESAEEMIEYYMESDTDKANAFYFGGHRPVLNLYNLRANGRYVQIHNQDKFIIARPGLEEIDLDRDIIEINNNIEQIIDLA